MEGGKMRKKGLEWVYGRTDGQSFMCFFAWIASMDSCTLIGCDRE
jgi:hypothetical protein